MNTTTTPEALAADYALVEEAVAGLSPVVRAGVRRASEAYATVKSLVGFDDDNARAVAEVLVGRVRMELDSPAVNLSDGRFMRAVGAHCRELDRHLR